MRLQLCIFVLMLLTACSSDSALRQNTNTSSVPKKGGSYVSIEGKYSNYDYAYSVLVPTGLTGCRDSAPSPNHGFGINLAERSCNWMDNAKNNVYPTSYLYVDASYNSLEWKSPDDAIKAQISDLKNKGVMNLSIAQRSSTKLSSLSAVRFVLKYNVSGKEMEEEMVLAFRKERGAPIVYTIDLTTPAERYDVDREVLARIQQTWEIQSLP